MRRGWQLPLLTLLSAIHTHTAFSAAVPSSHTDATLGVETATLPTSDHIPLPDQSAGVPGSQPNSTSSIVTVPTEKDTMSADMGSSSRWKPSDRVYVTLLAKDVPSQDILSQIPSPDSRPSSIRRPSASDASRTGLPTQTEDPDRSSTSPPPNPRVLSILLSALPSNIASEIVSGWNAETAALGSSTVTSEHSSASTPASSSTTSLSSFVSTSTTSSSSSSSLASSQPTMITTSSTPPWNAHTPSPPVVKSSQSHGLSGGAVAGIVIGSIFGAALLILGALLYIRRRGRLASNKKRIFPESAWLYDPSPTPPRTPLSHHSEHTQPTLQPGPQHRTPSVTMASPGSTRSQRYEVSSPEQPQLRYTPNGDPWINPFTDIPRPTLPLSSLYNHGRAD